jgi:transcriptional regulator with XRE-family HTH domain
MWEDFKKDLWQEIVDGKIGKIKYYRIIHKLTQKELASKLNMKQPNITRLESVGYRPDISTLEKLGKVFKIDYKELL